MTELAELAGGLFVLGFWVVVCLIPVVVIEVLGQWRKPRPWEGGGVMYVPSRRQARNVTYRRSGASGLVYKK